MKIFRRLKRYIRKQLGITELIDNQRNLFATNADLIRFQKELLKAFVFNNTISDSVWLKEKSFSPGGWAVDYAFLYTLYRVLNDTKPKNILEYGLGQSSKMIHQYASFYKDVKAVTLEHDSDWEAFFKENMTGNYSIKIKSLKLKTVKYNSIETLSFEDFEDEIDNQKFNLIVVDAPFGSEHYSRSQILKLVPKRLENSFCIILDDCEREGEKETVQELYNILNTNEIKFLSTFYSGIKDHVLICSDNQKFLISM